jgi:hypothetical protein
MNDPGEEGVDEDQRPTSPPRPLLRSAVQVDTVFHLAISKAVKMPACEDCFYFFARPDRCRRFPPTVSMLTTHSGSSAYTHWPAVMKSDWCGEFKSKVEPASIYDRPEVCNVPTP